MAEQPNDQAWTRELESMRPALDRRFRMLRGAERGPDLATSDVVQAAIARFVSYVRRLPALEREHVRRLLLRVLRNTAIDTFRSHRLRRRVFGADGSTPPEAHASAGPGGAQSAVDAEERSRLESALASLGEADRELVLLQRTGADWRTIAGQLGISEEAARRRWSNLKRRVRERMARDA